MIKSRVGLCTTIAQRDYSPVKTSYFNSPDMTSTVFTNSKSTRRSCVSAHAIKSPFYQILSHDGCLTFAGGCSETPGFRGSCFSSAPRKNRHNARVDVCRSKLSSTKSDMSIELLPLAGKGINRRRVLQHVRERAGTVLPRTALHDQFQ